jgi:hypothetical protein
LIISLYGCVRKDEYGNAGRWLFIRTEPVVSKEGGTNGSAVGSDEKEPDDESWGTLPL